MNRGSKEARGFAYSDYSPPTPLSYIIQSKPLVTRKGCHYQQDWLDQARSTFYVARGTSEKSGLQAGNMRFSTKNE
jgi:hypothetical protein